jgi:thioesterase domain-containing protein
MVPAAVIRLESYPRLPNGKVDYEALPAVTIPSSPRRTPPNTKLQEDLLKLWATALGSGTIGIDDDFFESGGDSLLAASIFHDIETLTGQKLPLTTLFGAPTVRGLAQALCEVPRKQTWSSLVSIKPSGDRVPLFCVHGVRGNVITYSSLAQYLRPDRPLYGLQSQGLDGIAPPFQSIEDMAAHYLAAIREVQPAGPYFLGGYSFGGWVALAMAYQLTIVGEEVPLLALFDSHKTFESRAALREFNPAALTIRRAAFHFTRFLRSDSRLGYVVARAKTVHRRLTTRVQAGRIETAGAASRSDPLRVVELANWTALGKYVPRKVRGRMTLFVTQDSSPFYRTPEEEWGRHADELQVHKVPGTHNAIFTEPHVQDLARTLNALLD